MTFKQTEQSYRTKEIVQKSNFKYENLIYKGLVCAVDMHRKAMKLVYVPMIVHLHAILVTIIIAYKVRAK